MKYKTNFSHILLILTMASALFISEKIRTQNKVAAHQPRKNVSREGGNFNISNTDFIFFESLSKYLFISLEQ